MIIDKLLSLVKNSKIDSTSKIYRFNRIYNSNIGRYTYVSPGCIINNCQIGNYCSIAKGVMIGMGSHPIHYISTSPIFYKNNNPLKIKLIKESKYVDYQNTYVGSDVWIGVNTYVKEGVNIGHGAVIGACCVVTKDVPPYAVVAGVPSKIIKYRFDGETIELLIKSKWWERDIKDITKKAYLFALELDKNILKEI